MRRTISFIAVAAAMLIGSGCAKEIKTSDNDSAKRYFDAWISVHHPELEKSGLGIYIYDDIPGSGLAITDATYLYVTYTTTDLKGNVSGTNDIDVAKKIGKYDKTYCYDPSVWIQSTQYAGVKEMLKGMKIGGKRTAIIPSWLMNTAEYGSEEEYLSKTKPDDNASNAIYTIEVVDSTDHIYNKQIEKIEKYLQDRFGEKTDSTYYGFYYKQRKAPTSDKKFPDDTTIYINYTGRLLNGQVFDTTIEDTAKKYNIYNSGKSYGPTSVKWAADSTALQLGGNGVIGGFSLTLWQMKAFESGTGVFHSGFGYSASGQGNTIPGYAPLAFDIEIVEKED